VFKQQGLGSDGADAAGAEELGKGDQQVDGKDDDFSHRADRIMTSGTCRTARSAPVPSHCEFATHRSTMMVASRILAHGGAATFEAQGGMNTCSAGSGRSSVDA
jgi:hypothetical protein